VDCCSLLVFVYSMLNGIRFAMVTSSMSVAVVFIASVIISAAFLCTVASLFTIAWLFCHPYSICLYSVVGLERCQLHTAYRGWQWIGIAAICFLHSSLSMFLPVFQIG
jgi:hypothetical protein